MSYQLLSIREMANMFDVSLRTLRFYEAKELINPVRDGSRRFYTRRCRVCMKVILQGKQFGFRLEETRRLLPLYQKDEMQQTQIADACQAAKVHLNEMRGRQTELNKAIFELKAEIRRVSTGVTMKSLSA